MCSGYSLSRHWPLRWVFSVVLALCVCHCKKAESPIAPASLAEAGDYTWSGLVFGIEVSMELYGVTSSQQQQVIAATEDVIQQVESSFSLYLENSELSILNRERVLEEPSEQFLFLLDSALSLHSRTKGYYQPAIHGAWSHVELRGKDAEQWAAMCEAASLDYVSISPGEVALTNHLTQMSFNALVQGYLADRVRGVVHQAGVQAALLHFGETYALGLHPDGRPWELAVMGTEVEGVADLVGTMQLHDAGLAVSAHTRERFLLNPRDWNIVESDRVVAVVAREGAMVADAFATAFAVAPELEWSALFEELQESGDCQVKIWVENALVFSGN